MAQRLTQGKLTYGEDIARGIESASQVLIRWLQGKNLGKQLVQIAEVERAHRTRRGAACALVFAVRKNARERGTNLSRGVAHAGEELASCLWDHAHATRLAG